MANTNLVGKKVSPSRETGNEGSSGKEVGNVRRRGGQPGNQNALRHGRWSSAALIARRLSVARLKALSHAVVALGMLREKHRHRVAPLRPDQVELLYRYDRRLIELAQSIDVQPPPEQL